MYAPLVGKQRASVQLATARGNVWEGAVRSSKTISSIIRWLQYVRTAPLGNLVMVGKTERTLKRNIIDPIIQMVGRHRAVYRAGAGELDLFGRTIYTVGAANELAASKIQGLTLAGAYCDEVTTYPESFFKMLTTRLSMPGAQWFATCNPDSKNHWLNKNYLRRAKMHLDRNNRLHRTEGDDRLNINRFSFTLDDNPFLDAEYVAELKRMYFGLFYKRYILGEWVLAEGAVFDMFDPEPGKGHVVDDADMPRILRWIALGVDYGTTNPFHAGLLALGEDKRLYVPADWRYESRTQRRQLTDAEYSQRLRGWLQTVPHPKSNTKGVRPEWTVVDPSAASFIRQLYLDGLTATAANNSVLDGIRTLSSLFGLGLLRINSRCSALIDELVDYAWDDKAQEKGLDQPLKIDDHGPDQLRYGVETTEAVWRNDLALQLPVAA